MVLFHIQGEPWTLSDRHAAATMIQAIWRGCSSRKALRPVVLSWLEERRGQTVVPEVQLDAAVAELAPP